MASETNVIRSNQQQILQGSFASQEMEASQCIHRAYGIAPKSIEFKSDIPALVLKVLERSILRNYFPKNEVIFAYADSRNEWYAAPNLFQFQEGDLDGIYRGEIDRASRAQAPISCEDRRGRKYFLIEANGAHVPVRHGTDPVLGNWLSQDSRIRIVYDRDGYRHPACEGIDYAAHGFSLLKNRIWWPLQNGDFQPSFKRIRDPYFERYNQLFVSEERTVESRTLTGVGLGALLGFSSAPMSVEALPAAFLSAAQTASLTQQAVGSFASQEASSNMRAQERRRAETQLQKITLDSLNNQDSLDLADEIIKAIQTNESFENIRYLVQDNLDVQLSREHLGKIVKQAAMLGQSDVLIFMLSIGPISNEDCGQALIHAAELENFPCVEALVLSDAAIPNEQVGQAAIIAAKLGNTQILKLMLQNRQILPEHRGLALIESVQQSSMTNTDAVLENGAVSTVSRGLAAIASCQQQNIAFLQKILRSGPILKNHRGEGVVESVNKGTIAHMREFLSGPAEVLPADRITMDHRGQASVSAVRLGKRDMLLELNQNGPISDVHKQEIVRNLQAPA